MYRSDVLQDNMAPRNHLCCNTCRRTFGTEPLFLLRLLVDTAFFVDSDLKYAWFSFTLFSRNSSLAVWCFFWLDLLLWGNSFVESIYFWHLNGGIICIIYSLNILNDCGGSNILQVISFHLCTIDSSTKTYSVVSFFAFTYSVNFDLDL